MIYGLLIKRISKVDRKAYIIMDDACHSTVDELIEEASGMAGYGDLVGAFVVDENLGLFHTLYSGVELADEIAKYRRDNQSNAECADEDECTEADMRISERLGK